MTVDDPIPPDRNRADDLMKSGRPAEAVPIYRKGVEAHPDEDSHLLALRLAASYAAQGQNDLAAAALRRAEALKPSPAGR